MAKTPTEIASEIIIAVFNNKFLLSDDPQKLSQHYEVIYKKILECRKEEKSLSVRGDIF